MTMPSEPNAAEVAGKLSEAMNRNLLALPSALGIWATVSEMRGRGATGSGLDILWVLHRDRPLCERRWTKWGGEPGQKRGEGFEYCSTVAGLVVRNHILGGTDD